MAMIVTYDLVEGSKVRRSKTTLEIIRPALVENIPVDCSVANDDPNVLLTAMSALPAQYTYHPNPAYPALLEDFAIGSIRSTDSVVVLMTYRLDLALPGSSDPIVWIKTKDVQTYSFDTYSTADGSLPLELWYKTGEADTTVGAPSGSQRRIGKARKLHHYKVMSVTGRMYYNRWLDLEPTLEPAELCINSDSWGTATRGQWLYLGPKVTVPIASSLRAPAIYIATVELRFLQEPRGHYPLLAYLNERREHPADTILESTLRALALPAVNGVRTRNGKMLASIYSETPFSPKFTFSP